MRLSTEGFLVRGSSSLVVDLQAFALTDSAAFVTFSIMAAQQLCTGGSLWEAVPIVM